MNQNNEVLPIEKAKEKYLHFFFADGYTEEQARMKVDKIFEDAEKILLGCNHQVDFCRRIENSTKSDPHKITPNQPFLLLPGLIEYAHFELDIQQLILTTMLRDGCWERTKPAMRFFELWNPYMTKLERREIIARLMETDEYHASHALALYFGKILTYCADDFELVDKIFRFIEKYAQFLPILSTVPFLNIPSRLRRNIEPWLPREKAVHSDNVIPVRHVNNYAGTCAWMLGAHYATLEGSEFDPDVHGNVTLLYVDGFLVGSMKHYKASSILGLRTIQNSQGCFAAVTSGVYVTTKEITIQAYRAFQKQGNWAILHLDQLPLFPIEFLSSEERVPGFFVFCQDIRERLEQ
jgi:hypothetical protein